MIATCRIATRGVVPVGLLAVGVLAGLLCAGPAAADELDDALKALQREREPQARLVLVRTLVAHDSPRSAGALEKLVRTDPAVAVRVAAAAALGGSRAPKAPQHLAWLVAHGGPRRVRAAVAEALRRHESAVPDLVRLFERKRTSPLERRLVFETFGRFRDEASFEILRRHALLEASPFRQTALRALATRSDRRGRRVALFARLFATCRDREALLTALDAAAPIADPVMKPAVRRLTTRPEPGVKRAAEYLLGVIEHVQKTSVAARAAPGKPAEPDDRYAKPGDVPDPLDAPPPGPPPPGRYDAVYLLDATGSAHGNIPHLRTRILDELALLEATGDSVRVGIISFRGAREPVEADDLLPLTFDLDRVRAFLSTIDTRGVDERGAAIARALHNGLDQMNWRARARRRVKVFADAKAEDPALARSIVSIHWRADETRSAFAYVLRTRTSVPAEFDELSKLGGTHTVELLR